MKLLSFYLGWHDSNIALFDGTVTYAKAERVFHKKHRRAPLKWVEEFCAARGFVPDAIAFSDGNRNRLGQCSPGVLWKEAPEFRFQGRSVPTFCLDHHYAHMLSGWPVRPLSEAQYGIAIDGKGDNGIRVSVVRDPGSANAAVLFQSKDFAIANFFNLIGLEMKLSGIELDFAGKIMGAQAYGTPDEAFIDAFDTDALTRMPSKLLSDVPWKGAPPLDRKAMFTFEAETFRNWLASVHALMARYVIRLFSQMIPRDAVVIYAGGAAQNSVINEELTRLYPSLVIPPHCYDGGLSLGCVEFLRHHFGMDKFDARGFPFWQSDPHGGFAQSRTIEQVADFICRGKIVAWFQGQGEIGPRALGHRSLLYDARNPDAKAYLNSTVKHREHWRPYAASVLKNRASELVETTDSNSPYMLRAIKMSQKGQSALPGVLHADGTCRIQTVENSDELSSFHGVLSAVEAQTGCPGVLNTSLNAGGYPIVSTPEQAMALWKETPIDVLCIGDRLWEK